MTDEDYEIRFDPDFEREVMGPKNLGPTLLRWLCLWAGADGCVQISGVLHEPALDEELLMTYPKFDA